MCDRHGSLRPGPERASISAMVPESVLGWRRLLLGGFVASVAARLPDASSSAQRRQQLIVINLGATRVASQSSCPIAMLLNRHDAGRSHQMSTPSCLTERAHFCATNARPRETRTPPTPPTASPALTRTTRLTGMCRANREPARRKMGRLVVGAAAQPCTSPIPRADLRDLFARAVVELYRGRRQQLPGQQLRARRNLRQLTVGKFGKDHGRVPLEVDHHEKLRSFRQ